MSTIKVTSNGAITLPIRFRKALGLKQGDFVNAELEGGRIILKPAKIIDAEDAWFHSAEWQAGEAVADKEIAEGKVVGPFKDIEAAIGKLKRRPR
jgi:AbrB family looped-hinge helix DNA binding protein